MARWKLMTGHYLHTPEATEWEHVETDQASGKQNRKRFIVPCYMEKDATVCQGPGMPGDIEFIGPPTPDMVPLDDEARKLNAEYEPVWRKGEFGVGTEAVMNDLSSRLAKAMVEGPPPAAVGGVSGEKFAELQGQVKMLMEQNAKLLEQLGRQRRA